MSPVAAERASAANTVDGVDAEPLEPAELEPADVVDEALADVDWGAEVLVAEPHADSATKANSTPAKQSF
jgi:hypothetical protein